MTPRQRLLSGGLLAAVLVGALVASTDMDLPFVLLGLVPAAVLLGPLFRAQSRCGSPAPEGGWERRGREGVLLLRRALASLAWRRVLWSLLLPAAWLLQYFAFVAHVRLALGRWPRFGENLEGALLEFHQKLCWGGVAALCASLIPVAAVFVACLFFRRWRPISGYALIYAAGVGLAFAGLHLAPGPFLNWFFD